MASQAGLTDRELAALDISASLAKELAAIIGDGPAAQADLREAYAHVHALQQMVMSQAAARAHPGRFRLLGESAP